MIPKIKHTKILIAFLAVMVGALAFSSSASAECGPAFTNKSQAVNYYKTNPAAANALKKWLLQHPVYEYSADQGLIQYLEQSNVRVFNAPQGYKLSKNTYCPNGPGEYRDYGGLLENMSGKPMLWFCNKAGKCFPILKGYCRNAVAGPPVVKKPPHKTRKPPKCKCKKPPPKKVCKVNGKKMTIGNCIKQTNKAKQECEVKGNHYWDSNALTCVQVQQNGVCSAQSGVVNGNNNTVNQDVNCGTEINTCVNNSCNVTPPPEEKPCGCKPKEEPKPVPPEVVPDKIQEFEFNETTKEAPICARARAGAGSTIVAVYLEAEYGSVKTPKSFPGSGEKYCNETYKAPSGYPPFECTEPGLDATAEWCDILTWTAEASNGLKTSVTVQVPVIKDHPF